MDRKILLVDCNCFFASVEMLKHPEYRDIPMAVGGNKEKRHGIILAKNEPAKRYGITTGEPIWQSLKKCPGLTIVPPHFEDYERMFRAVNSIYSEYTETVEPYSIDESYLDVTSEMKLFADDIGSLADMIRERVKKEIGITVSVGASFCKSFAKLGSELKKPDGTTVITKDDFREKVWPRPVSDLLYVGRNTAGLFGKLGIYTIGDLANKDASVIKRFLGVKGIELRNSANGLDFSPVVSKEAAPPQKSVGNGMTFPHDLETERDIKAGVALLSDSVCMRMKSMKVKGVTLSVCVRFPDLVTVGKQRKMEIPTDSFAEISTEALKLVYELYENKPIRMISISMDGLFPSDDVFWQLDFVNGTDKERTERLENTVFNIKSKMGINAVITAAMLGKLTLSGKQPRFM